MQKKRLKSTKSQKKIDKWWLNQRESEELINCLGKRRKYLPSVFRAGRIYH